MSEPTSFSLEDADLSSLFMPAWMKEEKQKHSFQPAFKKEERRDDGGRKKTKRHFSSERSFVKKEETPRLPVIGGWRIELLPELRGLDEMAKQIRKEMKAYSLFQLARLLLEKPQRYRIKLTKREGEDATQLFQCIIDETVWLSEKEARQYAFSQYRDRFYRSEKMTVDPPKGSYSAIGVCGMSQTLLGPPNHHEYQHRMRRLHAEQFSHIPFEVFKSRIQMSRDEALLERWKEEQSTQEIFYLNSCQNSTAEMNCGVVPVLASSSVNDTLSCCGGEAPGTSLPAASLERSLFPIVVEGAEEKIGSLAEVEEHFRKIFASSIIKRVEREVLLSHSKSWQQSAISVRRAVEQEVETLKRFPLSFSQEVGQALAKRGLQIFKAHENIVYASIARPRSLNQAEQAISNSVKRVLEVLKEHAAVPRAEQWKALLASRSSEQTAEEHEANLLKDLSWLLHEGYVVNYATRGFEVA